MEVFFTLLPHARNHLCQFDINLTYPQVGKIPTVQLLQPNGQGSAGFLSRENFVEPFLKKVQKKYENSQRKGLIKRGRDRADARRAWKRDLSQRANGTIDPYYGCNIYLELLEYAVNYTYPWDAVRNIDVGNLVSPKSTFLFSVIPYRSTISPQP